MHPIYILHIIKSVKLFSNRLLPYANYAQLIVKQI